jgi:hypothetical protein
MGLLVIFGAGASYDSISPSTVFNPPRDGRPTRSEYFRPPLARELFEDRKNFNAALDRFPQFTGRVHDLRLKAMTAGFNVEVELEEIRKAAENYPPARVELAAIQFYLRQVLWDCGNRWHQEVTGVTNYASLLSRIDRLLRPRNEHVVMVTFNYDYMLERAAAGSPLNFRLSDIDSYVGRDDYKLIKPHGSVAWGHLIANELQTSMSDDDVIKWMIEHVDEVKFTDDYVASGPVVRSGDQLLYPAIAIPVVEKSEFACPQSHIDALIRSLTAWKERREQVDDMRHVLIIGWRASENKFLDLLKGHLNKKRVLVIANGHADSEQTARNLGRAGVEFGSITCSSTAGFSEFLAQPGELEGFLRAD